MMFKNVALALQFRALCFIYFNKNNSLMEKQRSPTYFEAVIQLRNPTEELISFIRNQIKKRGNVFVAKEDIEKYGVDIYISDQRFARALGNKMKRAFKGELITSRRIFTRSRQTSRDVYRVTVCFRMEPAEPKEKSE